MSLEYTATAAPASRARQKSIVYLLHGADVESTGRVLHYDRPRTGRILGAKLTCDHQLLLIASRDRTHRRPCSRRANVERRA